MGLPGCGKSFFSHKVADELRKGGLEIVEPSWFLDNCCGKYSRVLRKAAMALCYRLRHGTKTSQIKAIIKECGYSGSDARSFMRNLLYKAYLLTKRRSAFIMFDEGIAQMAVSLSIGGNCTSKVIYEKINHVLHCSQQSLCIKIDCGIEEALLNMNKRPTNDSRVEKLSDEESKRTMLCRFKQECESLKTWNQFTVPYSNDTDRVVLSIKDYLYNSLI